MTAYQAGIPQGNTFLSVDVNNIRNNFNQLNTTYAVDHIPLTQVANNGIHKQVNMLNQGTPALLGDLNLYANTAAGSSSLWVQTAIQNLPLFSGPASAGPSGSTSLFGNVQVRWGNSTIGTVINSGSFAEGNAAGTTTFAAFAGGNIYAVYCIPYWSTAGTPGSAASVSPRANTLTASTFAWKLQSQSADYTGFYWLALGQ